MLRERLPEVATHTVAAVTAEVPGYTGALSGSMGDNIEAAVQMALAGFLKLAGGSRDADPSTPLGPTLEGAYALGRGEARSGRSMDALLAAYRVGARVAWRELASSAAQAGVGAATMAQFAELVFAYIDELSASSVAGHTDELSTSGRVRERYRERLGQSLLAGAGPDVLDGGRRAGRLDRAVDADGGAAARGAGPRGARVPRVGHPAGRRGPAGRGGRRGRAALAAARPRRGGGRPSATCSGCSTGGRPWSGRPAPGRGPARRTTGRPGPPRWSAPRRRTARPVDSEEHLARLVVTADPDALEDLRARALAPLADLRPATRERLEETLRSWLLHQGRRDAVAAELHVHAQTVRYRMGQLRELYGDRLDDPCAVLDLVVALAAPAAGEPASP